MSQIISFSADKKFAEDFENLMEKSGYNNRSRFIRDSALFFADIQQRGELKNMKDDEVVEGHIVIYYQHGIESKLLDIRHSNHLEVTSYNHSCLKHSHSCVDVVQAIGTAANYRRVLEQLQNTPNVDKVSFVSAPNREEGCC
jgi:metal-responsive CopG/Arc/MetJ family transcriptional regulator|tara:strand:- start:100 stop:525 length:426 start_codon:yes stop_codon:yes gene_type:complete